MSFAATVSRQSRAILVLVFLVCLAGLYAATQLPVSIFPQTDFPRIVIRIDNGVVPAAQQLASVTRPIEEAMNGLPGIARIRSTTARGGTEIDLFFDWQVDIVRLLQLVQGKLAQLVSSLPPTAEIVSVDRLTFAVFPVVGYSLTSETRDPAALRDLAQYTIRPRLSRLAGVANVEVLGGKQREYHVILDPERLLSHEVGIRDVIDALKNSNIMASPGLINENHRLELALVTGQPLTPDALGGLVVATAKGTAVTLAEVGVVSPGVAPEFIIITADRKPAVLVNVRRQPNANTIAVAREVEQELEALRSQLPRDVHVAPFYDQSVLVRSAVLSVRDAILIGLLLSVIILYGFLRNWGTTLVAVLVIPVTLLATFFAMWRVGLSFDLMTLGGVAAAIGLVIDDAIVVVENIYAHIRRGQSRHEAVQTAITELTAPIIGSTVTPVVVFLPLAFLTGVTGVFFRSLALTMAVALLTSLVLALTFTPVLAERFVSVRRSDAGAPLSEEDEEQGGRLLRAIIRRYERVLELALDHRATVLGIVAGVLLGAGLIYQQLGSEFLPQFDEGAFVLDYIAPPGTSLQETDRILRHLEQILSSSPEVESYSRRTGSQLGPAITEPNTGDILVKLKHDRRRGVEAVTGDIRKQIESSEPALQIEFMGILSDLIGDLISNPQPVEIKLFSEDTVALQRTARAVETSIKKIPGIVDTFSGIVVSGPAVTFRIDPLRAARLGVNASDVAEAVTTAMTGSEASTLLEHGRLITVRVVLPPSARQSLDALKGLLIRSPSSGATFRLDQVATLEYDPGQTEIAREGLRQMVAVTARLENLDLGSAVAEIKTAIAREVKVPPGMSVEYGGLYHEQQQSFAELAMALVLAIALVFVVLLIEFRSFAHPIAIVSGAVLALAGVLLALLVTGTTLNVVSLMGMIMVVGIVAKNGILMLDAVEEHRAAGDSLRVALLRSGRRRFRPVLMTSLAAILGMLPLALALGEGAEMLQPLAIGVIGGLTMALLLSLVLTPTIYAMLGGAERVERWH